MTKTPDDYTHLVSPIYESVYRATATFEAEKIARRKLRKPFKDRTPDEHRQCWAEDKADQRALRRALGLPARGKLTPEQKRRLLIAREIQTTLNKIEREEDPEWQKRTRELHRKQQAAWAKRNREKIAASQRKWKEKNPDYHRQADRDRYAAKKT